MSEKQKILLVPGFTEVGSRHQSKYKELSTKDFNPKYTALDLDRDYSQETVESSWTRQIGHAAIEMGDDPIIVAHSLSTGPALRAAAAIARNNNIKPSLILDSPVGTNGSTPVTRLVLAATVKTFRNIIDSSREPYGKDLGLEQETRLKRFKKVVKDMGVAARQLANVRSTLKEIKYAATYDMSDDLRQAVQAGVDVHILLNNKEDMDNTNKPKRWRQKRGKKQFEPAVPKSLADRDGNLLVPVSTRADRRASHDTQLYAPTYTNETYLNLTNETVGLNDDGEIVYSRDGFIDNRKHKESEARDTAS
jgi:hypothetical protein